MRLLQNTLREKDYQSGVKLTAGTNKEEDIDLPKSNVSTSLKMVHGWVCLRPSDTEPENKFYIGIQGETMRN
ncbi:hypothetical protein [Bacillus sp. SD075]|uniref:hypothetical protein n=1 Tax=Bacillus sp. SD075 TaxID=2781732 RepID=UPI001A9677AF|nr:hypothetical protein [Bacillus sp. SD075]